MRIFVDRDVGPRIGLALREVGVDVVLYKDWYKSGLVPDTQWIAEATMSGLVILSHDDKFRSRPNERAIYEAARARGIVLATRGATQLENLRGLLIAWFRLQAEMDSGPGPLLLGVDRNGVVTQYLPPPDPSARRRR